MKLYVVRHAHAGSRSAWTGDDRLRPLSKKGRKQADHIADRLAAAGIGQIASSPSVRCVETMQPLADALGLDVELDRRLAEGSDGEAGLELGEELRSLGVDVAAICSHGDVIPEMLWQVKVAGVVFHDPLTWPKGSIWELTSDGAHWSDARLVH